MIESGRRAGLLKKAPAAVGPDGVGGQHLDRDQAPERGVARLIHDTHAALADLLEDLVMRKRAADHWPRLYQNGLAPFRDRHRSAQPEFIRDPSGATLRRIFMEIGRA